MLKKQLFERQQLLKKIRTFFAKQGVIEVQTPMLLNYPSTDAYIDSICAVVNQDINSAEIKYLHTSPELEMKKLLAAGSGDIYQICSVFRDNEQGAHNTNEFTMLEYYRLGFDMHQLIDDVARLLKTLDIKGEVTKLSYAQAFFDYAEIDILNSGFDALKKIAKSNKLNTEFGYIEDLQIMLFVHLIEPKLRELPLCFIYDYPAPQRALAKVEGLVAHRFELYIQGVEIANGYDELQDAAAYQRCFLSEINKITALGKSSVELNTDFISNLQNPLPQCAGVSIGIERLLANLVKFS